MSIRKRSVDGTELHKAAYNGLKSDVKFFLEIGYRLEVFDELGRTPLHCACEKGHVEVVKLLLSRGANRKQKTPEGNSCLHLAARAGASAVIKVLKPLGADVNSRNYLGWTALHEAAANGHRDAIVSLLAFGASVSLVSLNTGFTPLHLSVGGGHLSASKELLEAGALVNDGHFTPLHVASQRDDCAVVELLVENGADVTATTPNGDTPLHLALLNGNRNVAETLVRLGANIEAEGHMKTKPLHCAVLSQPKAVSWLLSLGVNPNPVDADGATPASWAVAHHKAVITRTRQLLMRKGGQEPSIILKSIGYPPRSKETTVTEKVLSWMDLCSNDYSTRR